MLNFFVYHFYAFYAIINYIVWGRKVVNFMIENKEGFTLIELLAVIVILAVIALIATPIILDIINDARDSGNCRSVEGYAEAIKSNVIAFYAGHPDQDSITICVGDGPADSSCEIDATVAGNASTSHTGGVANGRAVHYNGITVSCDSYHYDREIDTLELIDCVVGTGTVYYDYISTTGASKK